MLLKVWNQKKFCNFASKLKKLKNHGQDNKRSLDGEEK